MRIGNENIDEVLFEYFEGNLSEQDKQEVKKFLDENPEHLDDFRLWEVSNAKQYALEESVDRTLLKPTPSIKWKAFLYLCGDLVLLVSLVFLMQLRKPTAPDLSEKEMVDNAKFDKNVKEEIKVKQNNTSLLSNFAKEREDKVLKELVDTLFEQKETIVREDSIIEIVTIQHTTILGPSDTLVLDSLKTERAISKANEKLSKREERRKSRELEKFKQRNKDKRQQQEFMKGNKPYVVPVNPNAF